MLQSSVSLPCVYLQFCVQQDEPKESRHRRSAACQRPRQAPQPTGMRRMCYALATLDMQPASIPYLHVSAASMHTWFKLIQMCMFDLCVTDIHASECIVLRSQVALKCSDLGHLAAPLSVHLKWVSALEAEFFAQGDEERARGMAISPLCDSTKEGVTKSQVGFFEFVVSVWGQAQAYAHTL